MVMVGPTIGLAPFEPINQVTPFTYRDNATYLSILRGLCDKLNETIDAMNAGFIQVDSDIADLLAYVNSEILRLEGLIEDVIYNGLEVNVKDYAAMGDGTTNDTAAIQAAINQAVATGRRLFFPPGVYIVGGTTDMLTIGAGIEMYGIGATIKVKNNNGSWTHIFTALTNDVTGMWVHDLTFDGNATNNQPVTGDFTGSNYSTNKRRVTFRLDFGSNITVERCIFRDHDCTWVIVSSNSARNISVRNNQFVKIGNLTNAAISAGAIIHDHSTVYLDAIGLVIADNLFSSLDAGVMAPAFSNGAISAMDTHGTSQEIFNNTVVSYLHGIQLSVSSLWDNTGMSVHHNEFLGCGHGIHITPLTQGLRNVSIHENHFEINHLMWKDHTWKNGSCGISLNSGDGGLMDRVKITDNIIKWKAEVLTGMSSIGVGSVSNGIQWVQRKTDHSELARNLTIARNIIDGAIDQGIYAQFGNVDGITIEDNVIRDSVSSANANVTYGVGLYVDANTSVKRARIRRNAVVDTQQVGTSPYGNTTRTILSAYSLWAGVSNFNDVAENNSYALADLVTPTKYVRETNKALFSPAAIRGSADYTPDFATKTTGVMNIDEAIWTPIFLGPGAVSQAGIDITTLAAGSTCEVGIYQDLNGVPGLKLYSLGTIDTTLTSIRATPLGNFPIFGGLYWVAFVCHGGAPTIRMCTGKNPMIRGNGFAAVSATDLTGIHVTGQSSLPTTAPTASLTYGTAPNYYLVGL